MSRLQRLCRLFILPLALLACGGDGGDTVLDPGSDPGDGDDPDSSPLNFDCSGVTARAYVTVRQRNEPDVIQVLDDSNRIACNISVDFLGKIAFTPGGDEAIISSGLSTAAKVQIVDVGNHSITRSIDVAARVGPSDLFVIPVVVSPDGELAFLGAIDEGGLFAMETATDSVFQVLEGVRVSGFAVSAAANDLWLVGSVGPNPILGKIDLDTGEFQSFDPGSFQLSGIAVSPDGGLLYLTDVDDPVARVVDTGTLEILDEIELAAPGTAVEFGPRGLRAFVVSPSENHLEIIDVDAGGVESIVPLQGDVELVVLLGNELSVSADGSTVLVQLEARVVVVDVSSAEVVRTLEVGSPELAEEDREVQDVQFRPR